MLTYRNAAARYLGAAAPAVGPVNFDIRGRERVLLLGPSGSGKSTLLAAATGLIPRSVPADLTGEVLVDGRPVDARTPAGWVDRVGYLHQNPEQMVCGFRVTDEIAFAAENQALPIAEIDRRVASAMVRLGLPPEWRDRRVATLSGGERQLVALAGLLAGGAPLTLADEPTASLSPAAALRVRDLLLGDDRPGPVLIVDHRLDALIDRIDRVIVLDGAGGLLGEGAPADLFPRLTDRLAAEGIWQPLASRLAAHLRAQDIRLPEAPVTIARFLRIVSTLPPAARHAVGYAIDAVLSRSIPSLGRAPSRAPSLPLIRLDGAACRAPQGPVVLRDVTMDLPAGRVTALVGANGAGKTSLALALAGAVPLGAGRRTGPPAAIVLQNPEAHLTAQTVADQVRLAGDPVAPTPDAEGGPAAPLAAWGLTALADRHPFRLSEGQKRRLALASVLAATDSPAIVLDEPTAGLDYRGGMQTVRAIRALAKDGRAVAVISHDLDFILRVADTVVVLAGGRIVAAGAPVPVFGTPGVLDRADLVAPDLLRLRAGLAAA